MRLLDTLRQTVGIAKTSPYAPLALPGSLPEGAVASRDLSGLAQALGDGLSVTNSLGPGVPIGPAHQEEVYPRWYDYTPGANVTNTPRQGEQYSFETLYGLANAWDVFGIGIEKRKEEFVKLEPAIRPRIVPGQTQKEARMRADSLRDLIADATGFLDTPDQQVGYGSWANRYLDDLFKGDCATFYLRANLGGGLAAVEVPDGTTFKPVIDLWGRIAQVPPGTPRHLHIWTNDPAGSQTAGIASGMACQVCGAAPAYAQVIKGMNWTWYGSDEILYQPRWLRGRGPYGHPPAEWVILSINRALRRQSLDLSWYTEGNLPAAFVRFPEGWSPSQASEFRDILEKIYSGNDAMRVKLVPIPGGTGTGIDRISPEPLNAVEEYLLHIGLASLGVSPMEMGFIRSSGGAGLGGKGIAEEQTDAGRARQKSLATHIASVYRQILARYWSPEIVLYYPSLEDRRDQLIEAQTLREYWAMGVLSSDWIAENIAKVESPGLGNIIVTGQGNVVPVALITAGATPDPALPAVQSPSAQPGVNTAPHIAKALGGGSVRYKGNLAKVVHRYLLRSYPEHSIAWALDPRIDWEYEPSVDLADIDMARRPGGRDASKVNEIADIVDQGASIEPAVLVEFATPDPAGFDIADGWHRTLGVKHAGSAAIPAFIGRGVPDEFREAITNAMQANSHGADVRKAADDLRKWRQKAIRAVKQGQSAAVPFDTSAIPGSHAAIISDALASARSVDDVWALFGGGQ